MYSDLCVSLQCYVCLSPLKMARVANEVYLSVLTIKAIGRCIDYFPSSISKNWFFLKGAHLKELLFEEVLTEKNKAWYVQQYKKRSIL